MLNKTSTELITFFIENKCLSKIKTTKYTRTLLITLLSLLTKADEYVRTIRGSAEFQPAIFKIKHMNDIPKSTIFSQGTTPKHIEDHIHSHSMYYIKYQFSLFQRKINIYFIVQDHFKINVYNEYAERILMWLHILHTHSSVSCSSKLNVIIYFTRMEKLLPRPSDKTHILDENNINTAYTYSCRINNDIVIYRKEEWFKVFIHETFHSFGLDFSGKDTYITKERMLQIFNVNSQVNLFEAYTEFWARIINAAFTGYYITLGTKRIGNVYIDKTQTPIFIGKCEMLIYLEQLYSCFQMVKILNYMKIEYDDIIDFSRHSSVKMKYRENTNVLSYYVIANVLMYNCQSFLLWCKNNNDSLFQSKYSSSYQINLCNFINFHYNHPDFIRGIHCIRNSFIQLKQEHRHVNLRNNLRMTICELE